LFNAGIITLGTPTLFLLSTGTLMIHLVRLLMIIVHKKGTGDIMLIFPVASSLILKVFAMLVLLSYKADNSIMVWFLVCFVFSLVLVVNLWLEQKFQSGQTEEKKAFLRAAHSVIFPLASEVQTKKQLICLSLQLFVGNIAAAIFCFSVSLGAAVTEDMFITQNMVKALCTASAFLVMYSTLTLYLSIRATSSLESLNSDNLDQDIEDLSESTPLLSSSPNANQAKGYLKKATWVLVMLLTLMLILASSYPLLLYQFNTCPPYKVFHFLP
jgi:hypothetical protein